MFSGSDGVAGADATGVATSQCATLAPKRPRLAVLTA